MILKGLQHKHEGHQHHEHEQCHHIVNILEMAVVEVACDPKGEDDVEPPATMKPSVVVNRLSAWHTLFMESGTSR